MCEKLRKYIYEVRGINISEAARELKEDKEAVRTWVNGVVPRPKKLEKIVLWSNEYIQPGDFYFQSTDQSCDSSSGPVSMMREAAA